MRRQLDIEYDKKRLSIRFPYERELVNVVRALPERWYDGATRTWYVPLLHLEDVVSQLSNHHFKMSASLVAYCEQEAKALVAAGAASEVAVDTQAGRRHLKRDDTWTVSALNREVSRVLQSQFPTDIWMVGELQGFDKNNKTSYRTYFFELVERPEHGSQEIARVRAILFETVRTHIEQQLAALPDMVRLRDGLVVRVRGRIDIYAPTGSYQFVVSDIDIGFTAGEIELNRERVFKELQARGIDADNRQREVALCPLRIGLITSYESDAYNDFIHHLSQSGLGFDVTVYHANVQGNNVERSVLGALAYFAQNADSFDIVAIVRGGGSRSDLAYFDTLAIGTAVCHHPLKIICGIGHQRDQCLLDLICQSLKTPTAAAEYIVEIVQNYLGQLERYFEVISRHANIQTTRAYTQVEYGSHRLHRASVETLHAKSSSLQKVFNTIKDLSKRSLREVAFSHELYYQKLDSTLNVKLQHHHHRLDRYHDIVKPARMTRRVTDQARDLSDHEQRLKRIIGAAIAHHVADLERVDTRLRILDPQSILERGFAIVRDHSGSVIKSSHAIGIGDRASVQMADGRIDILRVEENDAEHCLNNNSADAMKPET